MAPLLELRGVQARYGPIVALHDVSLTVGEGEVVALLGANGAGKTTTLRAISGLVSKTGEVVYAGSDIRTRLARAPGAASASRTYRRAAGSSPS